jgi:hypothetical protein
MSNNIERNLCWDGIPESIVELNSFRNLIKQFKNDKAINIIKHYADKYDEYPSFRPMKKVDSEEIRNVGLYTTALCLDVLGEYKKEILENKSSSDKCWTGQCSNQCKDFINNTCKNTSDRMGFQYFNFVIQGLSGKLKTRTQKGGDKGVYPGILAKITTMNKLYSYAKRWGNKFDYYYENNKDMEKQIECLIEELIYDISDSISTKKESVHPFYLQMSIPVQTGH